MLYYFYATPNHPHGESFLCSSTSKLKKKDCIIVDLECDIDICIAFIDKEISTMDALTSGDSPIEIIQTIDLSEHYAKKKALLSQQLLYRDMMERMKEAKNMDAIAKYAAHDPKLKGMLDTYESMNSLEAPLFSDFEEE